MLIFSREALRPTRVVVSCESEPTVQWALKNVNLCLNVLHFPSSPETMETLTGHQKPDDRPPGGAWTLTEALLEPVRE